MKTVQLLCLLTVLATARNYFTMDEQFYFDREEFSFQSEIKLGEARVGKVNGNYWDVKIPLNRKSWALAQAHGHQLMRNILRVEQYPLGIFLATALKESDLGCDHDIIQEDGVEFPLGKQWDAGDGFYQIEGWGASAYGEMAKLYPKRFPAGEENHGKLIGNAHFEMATIGKVYYDLMVLHYWKYVNGFRPIELIDKSADADAMIKLLSAAFYMGHQTEGNFYRDIFLTQRESAYTVENFTHFFDQEPYKSDNFYQMARDHAVLVHQCVKIFEDSASSVGSPENNQFYSFYDSLISWNDMSNYMEKLKPLYPEVHWEDIHSTVKNTFDNVKGGAPLSFRYDIALVIDELILALPVENPVPGLKKHYEYAIEWHDTLEYEPDFGHVSTEERRDTPPAGIRLLTDRSKTVLYSARAIDEVSLFSLRGQELFKSSPGKKRLTLPTDNLSTGIYYIVCRKAKQSFTIPFLKR